jgi:hypothetical protein
MEISPLESCHMVSRNGASAARAGGVSCALCERIRVYDTRADREPTEQGLELTPVHDMRVLRRLRASWRAPSEQPFTISAPQGASYKMWA